MKEAFYCVLTAPSRIKRYKLSKRVRQNGWMGDNYN